MKEISAGQMEKFLDWLADKYKDHHPDQIVMSLETKDVVGATVKAPGYRNNGKRRRILREFKKRQNSKWKDTSVGGLNRFITGERT